MKPLRISTGAMSETWAAPARGGFERPLVLERSGAFLDADRAVFDLIEQESRALAALPAPFRRILEVNRLEDSIEVLQERFIGVSGQRLTQALWKKRRLLPIEVWLALADQLCRGWGRIPREGPTARMVPNVDVLGVDLHGQVVLFADPDHSIVLDAAAPPRHGVMTPRADNLTPEHVHREALTERSRVFSVATVLVQLLTGARPMLCKTERETVEAIRTGDARWRPGDHEGCNEELARVLNAAMAADQAARPDSLEALASALGDAAGVSPATPKRVRDVVLAVDIERLRQLLATLRASPEHLPLTWREGGLDVLEDQLLESLVPWEQLPVNRAPEPATAVASTRAPRLNLAQPARRTWWQSLWPFSR